MQVVEDHRAPRYRVHAQAGHREFGRAAGLHRVEIDADGAQPVAGQGPVAFDGAGRRVVAVRAIFLAGRVTQHGQALGMRQVDAGRRRHPQLHHAQRAGFQQRIDAGIAAGADLDRQRLPGRRIDRLRMFQIWPRAGDQQPAFVGGQQLVDHRHPRPFAQCARWRRQQGVFQRQLPRRRGGARRRQGERGQPCEAVRFDLRPQVRSHIGLRLAAFAVGQPFGHQRCGDGVAARGGAFQQLHAQRLVFGMRFAPEMHRRSQQRRWKIRLHGAQQAFVDAAVARQRHAAQCDLHQEIAGRGMPGLLGALEPGDGVARFRRAADPIQPHPRVFELRADVSGFRSASMPVLRFFHPLFRHQRIRQRERVFDRPGFGRGLQFVE